MSFASFLFHSPGPVALPLRDLTSLELRDIGRLEQAIDLHRVNRKKLLAIGFVDSAIFYDVVDSAAQAEWEIEQLEESICQIRRLPEMEAAR